MAFDTTSQRKVTEMFNDVEKKAKGKLKRQRTWRECENEARLRRAKYRSEKNGN